MEWVLMAIVSAGVSLEGGIYDDPIECGKAADQINSFFNDGGGLAGVYEEAEQIKEDAYKETTEQILFLIQYSLNDNEVKPLLKTEEIAYFEKLIKNSEQDIHSGWSSLLCSYKNEKLNNRLLNKECDKRDKEQEELEKQYRYLDLINLVKYSCFPILRNDN